MSTWEGLDMKNGFIERMKKQTIGVEVEMYNITRPDAAKLVANYFGTYEGFWSIGQESHLDTYYCKDDKGRKWKFAYDSSICGSQRNYAASKKCELNTPVLLYEDIPTLQEILRLLRKAGAKSDPKHQCGIHIHVGADIGKPDGHTPLSLRNLSNLMKAHEEILIEATGLSPERQRWCDTSSAEWIKNLNKQKPRTMEELKDLWYSSHNSGTSGCYRHYDFSRYHMLNLHALFQHGGHGTVEFRLFQFDNPEGRSEGKKNGIHAGMIKAYIQLVLAMSQYAKEIRFASSNSNDDSNHKYAMRCWLLRLGFIGEEFKTARELLTRRLTGDAAYSGRHVA